MSSGTVSIIGAGTMGAGIAQVAATAGWTVTLFDVDGDVVTQAIAGIGKRLDRLVEKGRLTADDRDAIATRLRVGAEPGDVAGSDLLLEAVVEDLDIKVKVLTNLIPHLTPDAIIATNTSSLSVTTLGEAIGESHRVVGMHFFNPAPLMRLCEIIAGNATEAGVVDRVAAIADAWGKKVARAADVPGFIVNHVARPYYLEAFRILEEGFAPPDVIDDAMRTLGGFRMGPLELTDLIGQDVNTATTRSVWEQLDRPPLLAPSTLQEQLVAEGHLGRKTGRGVYDYGGDQPTPAIGTDAGSSPPPPELAAAAADFCVAAVDQDADPHRQVIFARILLALITQATHARDRGVATPDDIDTALRYGVNYPMGPFEWAEKIGSDRCRRVIETLTESRYRTSP
jgi:3-hydroxybutyryl-CoA dehydrogenase